MNDSSRRIYGKDSLNKNLMGEYQQFLGFWRDKIINANENAIVII